MSVEAMTWAFQVPLPPCPKSVLVSLANRADEDFYCWPGMHDLELRTGWKRRAIQQAIQLLVEKKLLSVSPRWDGNGQQMTNLYRLNPTTIGCVEGAPHAPLGMHQVRGEGAPHAPKSSSESSSEQSIEQSPQSPPVGGTLVVADMSSSEFHQSEFENFWRAYPKRVGKKAAFRAWHKARDRPLLPEIIAAVERAKESRDWKRGYIPNPATWLNQGRWMDEELLGDLPRSPRSMVELIG